VFWFVARLVEAFGNSLLGKSPVAYLRPGCFLRECMDLAYRLGSISKLIGNVTSEAIISDLVIIKVLSFKTVVPRSSSL
jgi:hypothetical protein